MRATVLLWSTFSGAILGLFVDAMLIGVAAILSTLVPQLRTPGRWLAGSAVAVLLAVFLAMTVLGYLEGRLKTV